MKSCLRCVLACALLSHLGAALAQVSQLQALTFANPEVLGLQGDAAALPVCCQPQLSQDGRFALFASAALNLVTRDDNGNQDLFVHDRQLGITTRVNVRSNGQQGRSGDSASNVQGAISSDGDLVVFSSRQFDLVDGDSNFASDLFLHRRSTGITTRVLGIGGAAPDDALSEPSMSGDGRFVVFSSSAENLVPNHLGGQHVFLLDNNSGAIERISVTPGGSASLGSAERPGVSDDGRHVIFLSNASDLVAAGGNNETQLYVRDRQLGVTRRLSEFASAPADLPVNSAMISGDGSRVVFETQATNLDPGDSNGVEDIYAINIGVGALTRISVDSAGNGGIRASRAPSISRNGQRAVFSSGSVLAAGGIENRDLLYLRDINLQSTSLLIPESTDASLSDPRISGDGQRVSFFSFSNALVSGDSNAQQDQFVRDLQSSQTTRVSLADASGPFASRSNGDSTLATTGTRQLSSDARYLVTATRAKNLGNGVAGSGDQIVRIDQLVNEATLVSTAVAGGPITNSSAFEPAISADGRYVVFRSAATNLVSGDSNSAPDVFWRDMDNNLLERVNLGPGNVQATGAGGTAVSFPTVSDDGNLIAYASSFTNLVIGDGNARRDIFVRDRDAASTTRVSVDSVGVESNGNSEFPVISASGRYVVFTTLASNLVAEDTGLLQKIIRHDRQTGATELVSIGLAGAVANNSSFVSAISADGSLIAFSSAASNLISGDSNARDDIFVRDMSSGVTTRVSVDSLGIQANGNSAAPSISADGRYVSFLSSAANLVPGDNNARSDIFLHDRLSGQTTRVSVDPQGRQVQTTTAINHSGQISPDGTVVAIDSSATDFDLVSGAAGTFRDVLLSTPTSALLPDMVFSNGFE